MFYISFVRFQKRVTSKADAPFAVSQKIEKEKLRLSWIESA
jgi:hypothetical protein